MKNFTVLLLLLFSVIGHSQVWIDSSAKWTFDYFNVGETGTWEFNYSKDTIIQSKQVQAISAIKHLYYSSGYISSTSEGEYYTYSSNDSVFYLNNGQFRLLYDFGAQIGDSWVVSVDNNSPCSDTSIVRVTDIGSMIINGQTLRSITLETDSTAFYGLNGLCVERFGILPTNFSNNNFGFMPGYHNCPGIVVDYDLLTFRCYQDKSFSTYNPTNKSCDTLTYIKEFDLNLIEIYPNPSSDYLNLVVNDLKVKSIEIIDLNGRKVSEYKTTVIDISTLSKGLYFVRLTSSENIVITKQFIKK